MVSHWKKRKSAKRRKLLNLKEPVHLNQIKSFLTLWNVFGYFLTTSTFRVFLSFGCIFQQQPNPKFAQSNKLFDWVCLVNHFFTLWYIYTSHYALLFNELATLGHVSRITHICVLYVCRNANGAVTAFVDIRVPWFLILVFLSDSYHLSQFIIICKLKVDSWNIN